MTPFGPQDRVLGFSPHGVDLPLPAPLPIKCNQGESNSQKNDELSGRALHPGSTLKLLIAVVAVIAIGVAVYFLPSPRALSPWSEWRTKNYPSSSRTVSSEG
jgi:hypothetical protein